MKRLGLVFSIVAFALCGRAHAANCPVSSGASQSSIQSTLNSCGSGNTVTFAAGTYAITSTLTVPCGVSLSGPVVAWSNPSAYTASINLSGSEGPIFSFSGCSTAASVKYLNFNGGQPSPDGGQNLYFPAGTSNMTVEYNFFHGNQGNANSPQFVDGLVYFDGNSSGATSTNDTISWNIFGKSSVGDCSNLMSNYTYSGFSGGGGLCNGLGLHNNMSGLTITNNIFQFQEQGMKFYEGQGECNNCVIEYNDYNNIHRISFETQANGGGSSPVLMYVDYNSIENQYDAGSASFGFSTANGCNSPSSTNPTNCVTHTDYNVIINNALIDSSPGDYVPEAIEQWGGSGSTASYNLLQGYWANGITWAQNGQFTENNNDMILYFGNYQGGNFQSGVGNTSCTAAAGGWWSTEDVTSGYAPSCSGNTYSGYHPSQPTGTLTSVAPTISPASGSFTTSQTVTFTNPGTNRDANTGIWYTTDGSTPTPGSGTAQYIASGGAIAVSTTTTVKAVGMWGAQNQPTSYPSGFGYVPSAVVSATYTAGSPPTLNSVSLTATGSVTSIALGGSVQINAVCHYNNATTTNCNTTDAYGNSVSNWNTSNSGIVSLSSSGMATGVAVGSANLTATAARVASPAFALEVTPPAVTLSSVTLTTTGGVSSIVAGATNQLIATCHYSDSSTTTCTTTDSHGNAVSSWTSAATTIATVSSGGLVTGVAAGSTNLTAVAAGITSSPLLTLTVTAAPPTLTGGYLGTPGSANTMTVGGTLQFSAYCQYSNSSTTNCTVPDIYGNGVTQWLSSNTSEVTVGAIGSTNPGLATAMAAGTSYIHAAVGSVNLNHWNLTITNPVVSLTGVSLSTTGGVTGLFVGRTNQLIATCTYSDGSTTNCTTTDIHGNVAGSYTSSNTAAATVGSASGLVTGVAAGTTNLTATAGGISSPAVPLTVLAVPSGIYVITLSGPVQFAGAVRF